MVVWLVLLSAAPWHGRLLSVLVLESAWEVQALVEGVRLALVLVDAGMPPLHGEL